MLSYNAFIFDLDGTLIDSMPTWHGTGAAFLEKHGFAVPEDIHDVVKTLTLYQTAEYFRHGLQALLDEKFTAGIRGRRPIVDTLQFQWDGIFYIRLHVRLEEVLRAEGTKEKTDTGE